MNLNNRCQGRPAPIASGAPAMAAGFAGAGARAGVGLALAGGGLRAAPPARPGAQWSVWSLELSPKFDTTSPR